MTHGRLHALADGIFAIVMTLLVLELKIPPLHNPSNADVWHAIKDQSAIIVSYFISFITLFIYWRAHNFVVTILAKNIDINLLTINGIFLLFVGLVPFSTQLAGSYGSNPLALSIYAMNIILIGLILISMRAYIERSENISNLERTKDQKNGALIRTLIPLICSSIAIPISFINTKPAFVILLFGVLINFHNNTADLTLKWILNPLGRLKKVFSF